jgi:hypothetical protein
MRKGCPTAALSAGTVLARRTPPRRARRSGRPACDERVVLGRAGALEWAAPQRDPEERLLGLGR